MKKKTVAAISLVLCLLLCMSLVACDNDVKDNPHTAKAEWTSDETKHWHDCATEGCTEKFEEAEHAFGEWETTTEADYGKPGEQKKVCSVCGYEHKEALAALDAEDNAVALKAGVATSKTYDGNGIGLSAADFTRSGDGAITFAYRVKDSEGEFSNVAPKDAGTYEVKVSVAATAEWKACETTVDYKIEKKELKFLDGTLSKVYDGTARYTHKFTEEEGLISGDECTYSFDICDYYGTEELINAGSYSDLTYPNDSETVSNGNYSVDNIGLSDSQGTELTITPYILSGLKISVKESDIDKDANPVHIVRDIDGVNSQKLNVIIDFMWEDLDNDDDLEFTSSLPSVLGTGKCKISFETTNPNYKFADNGIGMLSLKRDTSTT